MRQNYQSLKILKKRICDSGIKQKWIAKKLGMKESQLSEVLSGKRPQKNINALIGNIYNILQPFSNN